MRTIKFRSYSPKAGKNAHGKDLRWNYYELVDLLNDEGGHSLFKSGRYELMQYTGLKDKNGQEIYEGDIVRVSGVITGSVGMRPGFFWDDDDIFVIAWDSDIAAWSVKMDDFDTTDVVSVTYRNQAIQLIQQGSGEVIGNIYENPELIKENK